MSVDAAAEEQFGPYLVYERLGVGGMATVHRALEQGAEGFERMVALKRLLPHLAEDASFIKSFVREAKLASLLNHVNIVQIYELGRVGTEYFISMEYIDGRDLRRVLRHARKVTGPPPIHITVGLMIQLCDALDYAHNRVDEDGHPLGLVHRDISPSNLIITSGGHLKIIDFGIAKAQSSQLRTHTGRVKGKLAYMAPEAVSGSRDLDARSDIWACGVILHELLTARPLFASKNEYQTLLKVQRGDILPASTFNQACPRELDDIVFRALARDADQRFPNAAELRDALVRLKHQQAMQTGYRDIATWLDWAFGLEAPTSFSNNPDSSGVSAPQTPRNVRHKTPRPARNTEEDEAVEVVWGGGNVESEDGPVVLEDVPDVSGKHQRPKRDTENQAEQFDESPTPPPTHGTMPSIYGSEKVVVVPVQRSTTGPHPATRPTPTGPQPAVRPTPPPARTGRTTAQGIPAAKSQSDRMRAQSPPQPTHSSKTGPVQALDAPQLNDRMAAQRARDTSAPQPAPRARTESAQQPAVRPGTASGQHPTVRARTESPPHPAVRARTDSGSQTTPDGQRLRTEQEAAAMAAADDALSVGFDPLVTPIGSSNADDEITLSPETPVAGLPVVRFSKTTPPPPMSGLDDGMRPQPSTKQGIAPVRAVTAPRAATTSKAPSNIRIGESIAARGTSSRVWLYLVGAVVLAGGAAAAVMMSRDNDKQAAKESAPRAPARDTGTVRFVTEPADAEIKIGGTTARAGADGAAGVPWSTELPAGNHQIEIHRQGYKSWLTSIELSMNETQTLRVVLEPLTTAVVDASLTITTTPPGLEVFIDGKLQAQRTPIETTLKPGAHKISVRQNGVEVWQQALDAEASSDYEFNPSFTADKQRERAQRVPTRPAPAPVPDATRPEIKAEKLAPSPAPSTAPTTTTPTPPPAPPATATATVTSPAAPAPAAAPPKQTPPPPAPRPAPPAPAPRQQITAPAPPTTAAPTAPRNTAPRIVPPVAVKKLSGEPPSIAKYRNLELPPSLAAKLCIDETGKVTGADIMSKIERRVANDIVAELRGWRYAPYKLNGTATPACFVVTFRTK